MNLIPRLQRGGGFESLFTEYKPVQGAPSRRHSGPSRGSDSYPRQRKDDDEDTKGKITMKDLFMMIKEVDGLKNEKDFLFDQIDNFLLMENLMGSTPRDLSLKYSRLLRQVKDVIDNKKQYDVALKTAIDNGAMNEPAISPNGKLIVQGDDGGLQTVSLQEYAENPDQYANRILTVSNIADLRKYDNEFINHNEVFNTIQNSMGFESFQKLIDSAKIGLGSSTITRNGQFTAEGKASKGLEQLEKLKGDPRLEQILGAVTLEGLYEYKLIDSDQLKQINDLTTYMAAVLPDRAKTWAAFKLGTTDKNKAVKTLIFQYLLGSNTTTSTVETNYKGSTDKVAGKSKGNGSRSGNEEDPKAGYWRQVQAGQGGETSTYNILQGRGFMSSEGKYYGAVPGIDNNCSLADFLSSSGAGFLVQSRGNITFGDAKISMDSYNDIMVNAGSGMFVATLPMKDGHVDFDILDQYLQIEQEMKDSGLKEGTPEYARKFKSLISDASLDHLIDAQGIPRKDRFGKFAILEGLTSDRARLVSPKGKAFSINDVKSNYFINAGDDPELYKILQSGLSSKDRGDYKIDDGFLFWGGDTLYRGNIYIPISNNPINGMNADKNDIKQSTSYDYEEATQVWEKQNSQGSTGSNVLM